MVTDHATFAYLCDVYVLPEYRGRGLGRRMMEACMALPDLQGLRRLALVLEHADKCHHAEPVDCDAVHDIPLPANAIGATVSPVQRRGALH